MKHLTSAALLLILSLLPVACLQQNQLQQEREESTPESPREAPPLHLGAVHQVYPVQGFALLRIIGPMPGPGTTLITHPADGSTTRMGNLSISNQQPTRDGIIAADIRSGTIVKGDRVFRYRNVSTASEGEDEAGDIIAAERPVGMETEEGVAAPDPRTLLTEDHEATPESTVAQEEPAAVETTVLPTTIPAAAGSDPGAPSAPAHVPDYLNSIPDTIDGWDSM